MSVTDLWTSNPNAHEAEVLDALGVPRAVAQQVDARWHGGLWVVWVAGGLAADPRALPRPDGAALFRRDQVSAMVRLVADVGEDRARALVRAYPAACVLLAAWGRAHRDPRPLVEDLEVAHLAGGPDALHAHALAAAVDLRRSRPRIW